MSECKFIKAINDSLLQGIEKLKNNQLWGTCNRCNKTNCVFRTVNSTMCVQCIESLCGKPKAKPIITVDDTITQPRKYIIVDDGTPQEVKEEEEKEMETKVKERKEKKEEIVVQEGERRCARPPCGKVFPISHFLKAFSGYYSNCEECRDYFRNWARERKRKLQDSGIGQLINATIPTDNAVLKQKEKLAEGPVKTIIVNSDSVQPKYIIVDDGTPQEVKDEEENKEEIKQLAKEETKVKERKENKEEIVVQEGKMRCARPPCGKVFPISNFLKAFGGYYSSCEECRDYSRNYAREKKRKAEGPVMATIVNTDSVQFKEKGNKKNEIKKEIIKEQLERLTEANSLRIGVSPYNVRLSMEEKQTIIPAPPLKYRWSKADNNYISDYELHWQYYEHASPRRSWLNVVLDDLMYFFNEAPDCLFLSNTISCDCGNRMVEGKDCPFCLKWQQCNNWTNPKLKLRCENYVLKGEGLRKCCDICLFNKRLLTFELGCNKKGDYNTKGSCTCYQIKNKGFELAKLLPQFRMIMRDIPNCPVHDFSLKQALAMGLQYLSQSKQWGLGQHHKYPRNPDQWLCSKGRIEQEYDFDEEKTRYREFFAPITLDQIYSQLEE